MKTSSVIAIIAAIIIVGGGIWYFATQPAPQNTNVDVTQQNASSTQTATNTTSTASSTNTSATGDGTSVGQNLILGTSNSASLGKFLTAYNGMTLYTYSPDKPDKSNCTGQCAVNWPPYTVPSAAAINVPASLNASNVGTITRADGSIQVTYNHQPLYFYIKDKQPGDTVGQGVGGVWYVVKP